MKSILLLGFACCLFCIEVHAQQLGWAHMNGDSTAYSGVFGLAVSPQGNVYSTGVFSGAADFDPGAGTHVLTANEQSYISKFSSAGGLIWAGIFDSNPGHVQSYDICLDGQENIYVTGNATGTCDFDPGPGTYYLTPDGTFVVKLDSAGNFIWAKSFTASTGGSIGYANTVDDAGNVYVCGSFGGTTDFDPGPANYPLTATGPSGSDIYIAKLDLFGNFEWAKRFGGTGNDGGFAIAVDLAGNSYVTGTTQGGLPFQTNGLYNGFFMKLDSLGNTRWIGGLEGGNSYLGDIALDAQANIYITGTTADTCDVDPGPATHFLIDSVGGMAVILKLDSSGIFQRVTPFVTDTGCNGNSIVVDALGNSVIVGTFTGSGDFDPGPGVFNLSSVHAVDGFYAKIDTAGDLIATGPFSGKMYDDVADVGMDQYGNVFCGGSIEDTVDLDPGPGILTFISQVPADLFHLKLDFCSPPPPPLIITSNPSICAGDSVTLIATGGGILRWWDAPIGGTLLAIGNSFTTPALTSTATLYVQDSTCAVSSRAAITVTVTSVDTSVTNASPTLTANASAATYQWMYCDSAIIPGQTNASFTPTTSGSYAVAVTQSGCMDTSACYAITLVGIPSGGANFHLQAYPNPTDGRIQLAWAAPSTPVALILRNALGQEVASFQLSAIEPPILDIPGSKGIYLLELLCADGQRIALQVAKQ